MNSKRSIRNQQIADLVLASIISAIIIILSFTDLGYLKIGVVALTTIHIPVIIGAILLGKKYGAFLGFVFGVTSMIQSFISLATHAPFTNPLLSVLPRVLFGIFAAFFYQFLLKLKLKKYAAVPITMGVATLFHSIVVLFLLYFFAKFNFYFYASQYTFTLNDTVFKFIYSAFVANSIFEIIGAIIIGSVITIPLLILQEKQI